MANYQQGDRVTTPLGTGTVAYQRMAPPDYRDAAAVAVVLDNARQRPGYNGTIFAAEVVQPAPRCQAQLEAGPCVYTCTAAAGHVGEHRHGERSW